MSWGALRLGRRPACGGSWLPAGMTPCARRVTEAPRARAGGGVLARGRGPGRSEAAGPAVERGVVVYEEFQSLSAVCRTKRTEPATGTAGSSSCRWRSLRCRRRRAEDDPVFFVGRVRELPQDVG